MRVAAIGDSGCVRMTSIERRLTPLFVDPTHFRLSKLNREPRQLGIVVADLLRVSTLMKFDTGQVYQSWKKKSSALTEDQILRRTSFVRVVISNLASK